MAPSRPQTARAFVHAQLRLKILTGELSPGTRIVPATVAAELGVSVTPAREAVQDLSSEGLLEFSAYRAFTVRQVSQEEIAESFVIRRLLEPPLVRLAAQRARPETIEVARTALRELRAAKTPAAQINSVEQYYDALMSAAGSPLLRACLRPLRDLPWHHPSGGSYAGLEGLSEVADLHERLVDAIAAHDGDAAEAAVIDVIDFLAGFAPGPPAEPHRVAESRSSDAPLSAYHGRSRRDPAQDERRPPQAVMPAQPPSRP